MEETYKMSEVIFNKSPNIRFCYIKPLLISLTNLSLHEKKDICEDWVILPDKNTSLFTQLYNKIVG